jgi:hypothetical protein
MFIVQCALLTACSAAELNSSSQSVVAEKTNSKSEKFAVTHARLSDGQTGSGEVCFLKLEGIDETDLKNQDLSHLKDISPVLEKSISVEAAAQLKSPELRRSLALNSEDTATQTSLNDLQSDLRQAAASSGSQGKSCAHSAYLLKGKLNLLPEDETLNLSWGGVFGFCVWACAVSHSVTGPHEWPTRSSTPWTLPSYPSRYRL